MDPTGRLNLNSLLADRCATMSLLQEEMDHMSSYASGKGSLLQSLSLASVEDINVVAAASNLEELELALLRVETECRQRRTEQQSSAAVRWSSLKTKYRIGPMEEWTGEDEPAREDADTASQPQSPLPHSLGGKNSHTITLEEFQRKIVFERWTGNCSCPTESEHLLVPVDPSCAGEDISMVKPSAWLIAQNNLRKTKQVSWVQSQQHRGDAAENLSFVDFLKSLPVFHSVRVADLAIMERDCPSEAYRDGEMVLAEGCTTDTAYIIREGSVRSTKTGSNPFHLTRGDYFGECALTEHPSPASYSAVGHLLLICVPAKTFEFVLSTADAGDWSAQQEGGEGSNEEATLSTHIDQFLDILALFHNAAEVAKQDKRTKKRRPPEESAEAQSGILGEQSARPKQKRRSILQYSAQLNDDGVENEAQEEEQTMTESPEAAGTQDSVQGRSDEAKNPRFAQAESGSSVQDEPTGGVTGTVTMTATSLAAASARREREALMLELLTSLSPELGFDDIAERICRLTKEFFAVDRVGFFLVDKENEKMILKVSQEGAGFSVPLKGIAGHIARTAEIVNLPDCYEDHRFDPAMDMRTGYRTKQMLCVPVMDVPGNVIGVLQCINTLTDTAFTASDEELLEMVAEQIGNALKGVKARTAQVVYTPIHAIPDLFSMKIGTAFISKNHNHLKCVMRVYHGGVMVQEEKSTPLCEARQFSGVRKCEFDHWLKYDTIRFSMLPQACRVIFSLYSKNNHPVGWCGMTLFTFDHLLKTGEFQLYLWDGECPSPNVPSLQNVGGTGVDALTVVLPSFPTQVIYETNGRSASSKLKRPALAKDDLSKSLDWYLDRMAPEDRHHFLNIMMDPISHMSPDDKQLVWRLRYALVEKPDYLPKFLLAVDWFSEDQVSEAHRLLYYWDTPTYVQALQILDQKYPDPRVRAYAVQLLGSLSDDELHAFLLQLVQLIKFEPFADGALVRFLLRRALGNPELIGHTFFWYLKAEMHVKEVAARFGVLLNLYMRKCGGYRTALGHQMLVMRQLETVALAVGQADSKEKRLQVLRERLAQTDFPSSFQLPHTPNIKVRGIVVEKCRVMESKKKPLWLVFENADPKGGRVTVMFKCGDDLRQDQLTLQILALMDRLWKQEGLDLHMSAYKCISTGNEIGMLEIVGNSATLANIVASARDDPAGGRAAGDTTRKLMAAMDALYRDDVLINWLALNNVDFLRSRRVNETNQDQDRLIDHRRHAMSGPSSLPDPRNNAQYIKPASGSDVARQNFLLSCAGYCVATFVLGIGDRHNDNIMMKRTGELFHIDFGHFLGNFKWKYGIKRERAPFVFTPAFAAILGGPGSEMYRRFEDMCVEAFLILRRNSSLLVTLFSLMVSCGIPELQRDSDIAYLRDNLMCFETDAVAATRLKELITQCLNTRTTQFNDAAHLLKHA